MAGEGLAPVGSPGGRIRRTVGVVGDRSLYPRRARAMRRPLLILGVLWIAASAAHAGPNVGWRAGRSRLGTSSANPAPRRRNRPAARVSTTKRRWSRSPPIPPPPHATSLERLRGVSFREQSAAEGRRVENPVRGKPHLAVRLCFVSGGAVPDQDGPGTDFYIGDLGFPTASGGQIGQSFPTGPRLTTVVKLFRFWGFGL